MAKNKCCVCGYESDDEMEFVTDRDLVEEPFCRDCYENNLGDD